MTKPRFTTRAKDIRTGDIAWLRGNRLYLVTVNETGDFRFTLVNVADETDSFDCNGNLRIIGKD
jgi:hypothetical protein